MCSNDLPIGENRVLKSPTTIMLGVIGSFTMKVSVPVFYIYMFTIVMSSDGMFERWGWSNISYLLILFCLNSILSDILIAKLACLLLSYIWLECPFTPFPLCLCLPLVLKCTSLGQQNGRFCFLIQAASLPLVIKILRWFIKNYWKQFFESCHFVEF